MLCIENKNVTKVAGNEFEKRILFYIKIVTSNERAALKDVIFFLNFPLPQTVGKGFLIILLFAHPPLILCPLTVAQLSISFETC